MKYQQKYLSVGEKLGYGLGDMASNLYFQTFVVFMPIFTLTSLDWHRQQPVLRRV